ncbi:MAG: RidA family protein [Desulfotalea sp.]
MSKKQVVSTSKAPSALGPYSQAIKIENMVYTSGSLGIDPSTGKFVEGDVQDETRQVLKNLQIILEEAGSSLDLVVKATVFVADLNDFAKINEVYAEFFTVDQPARSCVQVAKLPLDGRVEIETIALLA